MLAPASAAALPRKIAGSTRFVPSLSARAVDSLLRRNERQMAGARLLGAGCLLDLAERRLFRQLGYGSVMHYGTRALGLMPRGVVVASFVAGNIVARPPAVRRI